ncbi:hypothetical protein [Halococcus salsus]|uniref:hypothetical protein n=1 Tax=Halococcus salsus TaxID=2162894 RepID=UPI00135C4A7D|nr:hypothetical protein [Halococcus salsus]
MSQRSAEKQRMEANDNRSTARYLSEQLAAGFQAHDRGSYSDAIEHFYMIDKYQFENLGDDKLRLAATAFVDALEAKDEVEFQCLQHGDIQQEAIMDADYSPVRNKLRQRASIIGADSNYAVKKAEAWRKHKAGGNYWTPFGWSQVHELRAALQNPDYPSKPRAGKSGLGPEPLRYVLAFELHDMHTKRHWQQGIEVMIPYYETILTNQMGK